MVDATGLEHGPVDLVGVEAALLELVRNEPGLEELAAGQPGHDDRDPHLVRPGDRDGVDGLVAALADVGVAIEAVAEDVVHDVGGGELVADAEVGDAAADVVLRPLGDESVVEGQRVDVPAPFDQLVERVGRVLASRQEVKAVDVAPPATPSIPAASLEVGLGPEPPLGLGGDEVERVAHVADALVVELGAGDVDPEAAPPATGHLARDRRRVGGMPHPDEGGADGRMGDHRRLDLGRLEADAVHLELVVHPSAVGGDTGPDDPDAVAGAVPLRGRIVVGIVVRSAEHDALVEVDEPFVRLVFAMEVGLGHTGPVDPELAPGPGRRQVTEAVEHGDPAPGSGMTDRDVGGEIDGAIPLVDHAADDRLGRSVLVEDPYAGLARVGQPFGQRPPEGLSADDDRAQRAGRPGESGEQLELRRRRLEEGDPIVESDPSQRGDGLLVEHDHPSAREEGQEETGHGEVEDEGRVERDDGRILRGVGVRLDGEAEVVRQASL